MNNFEVYFKVEYLAHDELYVEGVKERRIKDYTSVLTWPTGWIVVLKKETENTFEVGSNEYILDMVICQGMIYVNVTLDMNLYSDGCPFLEK